MFGGLSMTVRNCHGHVMLKSCGAIMVQGRDVVLFVTVVEKEMIVWWVGVQSKR